MAQAALRTNSADEVGEFVTDASAAALNAALAERGIEAGRIIAVLPVAAQTLVTIAPERFRVLYRLGR